MLGLCTIKFTFLKASKHIFFVLLVLATLKTFAHNYHADSLQEFNSQTQIDSNLLAPREAYFIGGDSALYAFINKNYNQELIKKIGVTGTIYSSFIIDETGRLTNCEILMSLHPELDAEFIRVLYLLPNWVPKVSCAYRDEEPKSDGSTEYCGCKYYKQKFTIPFQIK